MKMLACLLLFPKEISSLINELDPNPAEEFDESVAPLVAKSILGVWRLGLKLTEHHVVQALDVAGHLEEVGKDYVRQLFGFTNEIVGELNSYMECSPADLVAWLNS